MDIYRALIGDPPTEEEKLQAIAQALRARSNAGLVAQTSGNRYIAPAGGKMIEDANTQAQQLGVRGESARYRRFQEDASKRGYDLNSREQAWKEADAIAQRKHEMALEALRQRGDLAVANAGSSGGPKSYRKMSVNDTIKLQGQASDAKNFSGLVDRFDDDYVGVGKLITNPLAKVDTYNILGKKTKAASDWWADYRNFYEMPKRNEMFGATLTDNEKKEWAKNAIAEGMSASQIRTRIGRLNEIYDRKMREIPAALKSGGYDPDLIDELFGEDDVINLD